MSVKIRIGYVCFISFFIICLISLTAHAGADFNGLAGVSVGYDNNASLSQEEKNSAFVSYRAKLGFHIIPQNAAYESDIFAEAIYRDYFTLEDNYRMKASGYMTWHTAGGLMFPGIFAELSSYRDGLNPADEKDGVLVGGKLDWLASARITLGIQQVLSWQNYINSAEWYAHRDNPSPLPRISAMLFQPPSSSPSLPMSISAPPAAENQPGDGHHHRRYHPRNGGHPPNLHPRRDSRWRRDCRRGQRRRCVHPHPQRSRQAAVRHRRKRKSRASAGETCHPHRFQRRNNR